MLHFSNFYSNFAKNIAKAQKKLQESEKGILFKDHSILMSTLKIFVKIYLCKV